MVHMTHDHQNHSSDSSDDASLAGFQRLRDQAAASGIEQDVPLNAGKLLAGLDQAPAPITLSQLRELAAGVRAALDLARKAAPEFVRDEGNAVDPIVAKLQEVVDAFPAVPGAPL